MTFPAIILIEVSHFFRLISSIHPLTWPLANGQEASANPFGSWLYHLSLPPWLWLEHRLSYAFKHHHRVIYNVRYLETRIRTWTQQSIRSFAVGLGPLPFVMIPEVSPPKASSFICWSVLMLT